MAPTVSFSHGAAAVKIPSVCKCFGLTVHIIQLFLYLPSYKALLSFFKQVSLSSSPHSQTPSNALCLSEKHGYKLADILECSPGWGEFQATKESYT